MADRILCRTCGSCAPLPYEALCRACATVGESLPALGHSIARFARDAEIDALVKQIVDRASDLRHTYALNDGGEYEDHCYATVQECARRLAQLARDGGR